VLGSHNLGVGSVPTAGDNPPGGVGTGDVDSVTATVPAVINNTDPANPVLNVAAAAPPMIGPSSAGTSNDVPRGNHTHPWASVADLATLAGLSAATMNDGTQVYVATLRDRFELQTSTLTATATTVIAALGAATKRWVRMNLGSAVWAAQTTWEVNTTTGSDEAAGAALTPLLTVSELSRRIAGQRLAASVAITIVGSMVAADTPTFTYRCAPGVTVTFTFTPTVLFTRTITTATNITIGTPGTDQNSIFDAGIGGGSFTAAGAMADAVIGSRTNGTAAWFWWASDLGGTTARVSQPYASSGVQTLANGDTYTASTLPTAQVMRFTEQRYSATNILFARIPAGPWTDGSLRFDRCWIVAQQAPGVTYSNCGFQATSTLVFSQTAAARGLTFSNGGMARGTGTQSISIGLGASYHPGFSGTFTLQSCALNMQSGTLSASDDLCAYYYTGTAAVFTLFYWGVFSWFTGVFHGSGNQLLVDAAWNSLFGMGASPGFVAGASALAEPFRARGTPAFSVANLANGAGVTNRGGNGVFYTNLGTDAALVAVTGYAAVGAVAVAITNAPAGSPAAPVRYAQIPDGAGGVLTIPSLT
jgi:hypothetical protein